MHFILKYYFGVEADKHQIRKPLENLRILFNWENFDDTCSEFYFLLIQSDCVSYFKIKTISVALLKLMIPYIHTNF